MYWLFYLVWPILSSKIALSLSWSLSFSFQSLPHNASIVSSKMALSLSWSLSLSFHCLSTFAVQCVNSIFQNSLAFVMVFVFLFSTFAAQCVNSVFLVPSLPSSIDGKTLITRDKLFLRKKF